MEHFDATDKLTALVGQHEEFAEAKMQTDRTREKCLAARKVLEQHWKDHRCHARESNEPNPTSRSV